jgi:beta-N-acetylhexosaminidase
VPSAAAWPQGVLAEAETHMRGNGIGWRARGWARARAWLGAGVIAVGAVTATAAGAAATGAAAAPVGPSSGPFVAGAGGLAVPAVGIPKMTDQQLAGQRVIYSYRGLVPPPRLLSLIRHGRAAGVIFFSQNISSPAQIASVTRELEHANASSLNPVRLPLLLMTDQEGGSVRRLPGAPVLSEKQIGSSAHPAVQARAAGAGAASNLLGAGMNVNLAPVLDVFRTAGNFIDRFGRSYSKDPNKVSYLGADFIKAQQAASVAATAKHFPGLGAATRDQDTDVAPVTLSQSAGRIRGVDELPYKAAIAAAVKLVMVSWAVYPSLDRSRPAGLSATIVRGELRRRLGFQGVTITDALEAGALRAFGTTSNRGLLAAQAGMDLLLCSAQSAGQGIAAGNALASAYRDGQLNGPAFRAAVGRILALRATLPR